MNKINEILDYGLLAELAYLRLEDEHFNGKYNQNSDVVMFLLGIKEDGKKVQRKNKNGKLEDITSEQLKDETDIKPDRVETILSLLERYEIKEFTSDDGFFSSDFQAMLLQNISTKNYVIAFRGTSSVKDGIVDAAIATITANHNFQLNEAVDFTDNMKKKYNLSESNLSLTGHSLGGILSQYIGSKLQIPAFAFNPLGTSSLEINTGSFSINNLVIVLKNFGILHEVNEEWINKNIITLSYLDIGLINGDILSNLATNLNNSRHLGIKIEMFGSDVSLGGGHSINTINKLLEAQSNEELTTIEDIKSYNKKQKTLFLTALKQNRVDEVITMMENKKCLFSVQTTQAIKPVLEPSTKELVTALNHENIKTFILNANVQKIEYRDSFDKKLYYSYEKNRLKLKTQDFKEASMIVKLMSDANEKLKKHDIKIQLQGVE